jgi:acyl dehydratase/putative sterol carrier protein
MATELTLAELASSGEIDLGTSDWVRVEQRHIDLFADATGDHQWIHVDREAAAAGPFGGTIAHGYLSLSLLPTLLGELIRVSDAHMGVNYGTDRVRFTSPVPSGSEVRAHARLLSAEPRGEGILYKVGVEIEIRDQEKPAMVGEVLYLALGAPASDGGKEETVTDGEQGQGPGLDEVFEDMQADFQPDKAAGVDARIQWLIADGGEEKPYAITIADGQFSWQAGQAEAPTVTLSTDRDSFVALMTGKAQGPALYMSGKLRIQGDLMLAQRMGSFFASG